MADEKNVPAGLTRSESAHWVAPLPDSDPRKPTLKILACLGCGQLPQGHPGTENCMRRLIAIISQRYPKVLAECLKFNQS